ncbi:interleukin-26 [Hyperolius riggenbachi]|uniref:interleukin-26 n=1 Tax=Hyperolius riggenbachi TaxID=752182 RepID=UPI0035A2E6F5
MKQTSIFMQLLCLAGLIVMAFGARLPLKKRSSVESVKGNECSSSAVRMKENCFTSKQIQSEVKTLNKKTSNFKNLFQDKNTSVQLLTESLENEFKSDETCSTRHNLLSFYMENVFCVGNVTAAAKRFGIFESFLIIEDTLTQCLPYKCESTEETENMREFKKKFNVNKKNGLRKAIRELDTLLHWIHDFVRVMKSG